MAETKEALIEEYYQKKKEGLGFSEIRKELMAKQLDEETISDIIKTVDDRILRGETSKSFKMQSRELKRIGLFVMLAGGIATLGSYFKFFDLRGYYIVAYGPLVGGYLMILSARMMDKRAKKKSGNVR